MRWTMIKAVIKADLYRLLKTRDYWIPLLILSGMFFVVLPAILLGAMSTVRQTSAIAQIGDIIGTLPAAIQANIQGDNPAARASYAFAVYLLAPIAIIVPLTISSAVGANSIVGERERGTGEFLAHSPLTVKEIYIGKLIASLIPGYAAGIVGFGLYSIVVNVIVGSQIGRWFFPTTSWILLVLWVVPPFIAIALPHTPPFGSSAVRGVGSSGLEPRHPPGHPDELHGRIGPALQPRRVSRDCWAHRMDHRRHPACDRFQVHQERATVGRVSRSLDRIQLQFHQQS